MKLSEAIAEFRRLNEATTSSAIATRTTGGLPFFGKAGLATIERERRERMRRAKKTKCKGYDPECRDKEWEVQAPVGGVALLRRSCLGER